MLSEPIEVSTPLLGTAALSVVGLVVVAVVELVVGWVSPPQAVKKKEVPKQLAASRVRVKVDVMLRLCKSVKRR